MNWNANRDMLKRIAALLFALAELADHASLASPPARALLLAILRPAEAVAQAFVFGMARDLGAAIPHASPGDDDPDDMTRLALSLRILALTLVNLWAQAEYAISRGFGRIVVATKIDVLRTPRHVGTCRQSAPLPADTS